MTATPANRRRIVRRQFGIEKRYIGPRHRVLVQWQPQFFEWHIHRWYASVTARDQAIENLRRKFPAMEYRAIAR